MVYHLVGPYSADKRIGAIKINMIVRACVCVMYARHFKGVGMSVRRRQCSNA